MQESRRAGEPVGGQVTQVSPGPNTPLTDREKWEAECAFRDRELSIKEREQSTSTWHSPVTLALLAAAVAASGNAYVAWQNGELQRELESQRAEDARILEVIRTGDPDKAAENLQFLLDIGLIDNIGVRGARMGEFLATRQPGTGPALSAPISNIRALPTSMSLEATPSQQSRGAAISVVATLYASVGAVTPGTHVAFRAVNMADGSVFGEFRDVTLSAPNGKVTAQFVPGSGAPIGRTTIIAQVSGASISASTMVDILP